MTDRRLIIVANRLPVSIAGVNENAKITPASGGLVSAIKSYLRHGSEKYSEILWAGVPGCGPTTWNEATKDLKSNDFTYLPVLPCKDQYEKYYNGFSNSVLWPLFHYFPSFADYNQDEFESYLAVNQHFADLLVKTCRENDIVWIHDYHLMPLAGMLRKQIPNLTIGFFLHIPFPSFELFRLIPKTWQESILKGLLGADLVGFHTIDYASHFLKSVQMALGLDNERNIIRFQERLVKVDVFPISIDYECFSKAYSDVTVAKIRNTLIEKVKGQKIIFSVDRLDYTKGVQNRLKAYELFLKKNPQYHNRVTFFIVVVPSRDAIPKYAERKRMIDELISQINSHLGNLHWQPIVYLYNSVTFEEMVGLYSACDLALITPVRDGMNLVSKEFVASRKDQRGVLILSELAGAARELIDAVIINPTDVVEIAQKIKMGLEMTPVEQERRMMAMQKRIRNYDVNIWAEDFMKGLSNIKQRQNAFQEIFLDEYSKRNILDCFRAANKRLLLLDYDGTLVSYSSSPDLAVPGADLLELLASLGRKANTDVFLISGRSYSWLDKYFAKLPIHLIAEHGARGKKIGQEWQAEVQTHSEWKEQVYNIMEMYVRRCPQSFIEEKEFSVVWHYRNANSEQGSLKAQELTSELGECINNKQLEILAGNKIVEVRNRDVHKGTAIKKVLEQETYDFIFAVGDDKTDEDMFKTLVGRENCFTVKVGPHASYAQFNLLKPQMVISLLEGFNHLPITTKTCL